MFDECGHVTLGEDLDVLRDLVRSLGNPVCAEVGTWSGSSALAMIAGGARQVFCVDTWQGTATIPGETVFAAFIKNIGSLHDTRIFPCKTKSRDEMIRWWLPFDLVFIDADHSYEECKADIEFWTPKVKPGGIVCGHDVTFPDVERAVRETGTYERGGCSMWYRRKS
jgi:predicted O-methyltransferase YrrM